MPITADEASELHSKFNTLLRTELAVQSAEANRGYAQQSLNSFLYDLANPPTPEPKAP
jgi:hypothetical protein